MTLQTKQADIALDPMAGCLQIEPQNIHDFIHRVPTPTRVPPQVVGEKPEINTGILALDLGHKLGWALRRRDGRLEYGTQVFTPRASWSPGQKWNRYRSWLSQLLSSSSATQIAYEDVRRHLGTDAAHAYGGFLAMLEMVADQHNVTLHPVAVGTIKKHWTGSGSAKKDAMIAEAKRRGFRPDTDNAADALAILSWAVAQERTS